MREFQIVQNFHTKNDCYKNGKICEKDMVIVHSVGCKGTTYDPRWKKWNVPGFKKCAHAFVDYKGIYQCLPWHYQGWLNGVSAGNNRSIAFEICEPLTRDDTPTMAKEIYDRVLYLCVHLCKLYNIPAEKVVCHREAHQMKLANNHSDVMHWWGKKGTSWEQYTMTRLRAEVKAELGGHSATPNVPIFIPPERAILRLQLIRMRGTDVLEAQKLLTSKGYALGALDGVYGPKSAVAVKSFQSANKIAPDGIVGPVTWAKLTSN